jgi:hypothetical protein
MVHFPDVATPPHPDTGAAADDADAGFGLGMRLIAEADTFDKFEQAVATIERSASQGHAEATCMLATLEAVGAARPRDWNRALACLELAAERGSDHARGQLRLLVRMSRSPPDAVAAGADDDWRGAPGRVDMERLLHSPVASALSERPRLRLFKGFAQPDECRWVIDRLRPKLQPAVVWDVNSGETLVDPYRSNSAVELPLQEIDVVIELLRARISAATRLPEFIFEPAQLMHYAVGEEFRPHHDFIDPDKPGFAAEIPRRGQRMGTFLVYLNDDFTGGETEFPKAGISFRGRMGDALFLANVTPDGRPDPLTLHAGRPPKTGEKWILSQWIRDRPPIGSGPAASTR